jgi:putative MATE family efflux protein
MTNERKSRLDEFLKRPRRAVWVLALPMMAGFGIHAVYIVVDTYWIGKLGPMALAGVTYVTALFFTINALGIGFAAGVTATLAQSIGRRDKETADKIASGALAVGLGIGIAYAAVGLLTGEMIIPLLGAEGESARLAWDYFMVMAAGAPVVFISVTLRAVLTGEGDAKRPMMVLGLATVLNMVLDPIFIFTLGLGVFGAALSTFVCQLFSVILLARIAFIQKTGFVRYRAALLKPTWRLTKPIIAIGLPVMFGQLVMAAGFGLTNRVLAEFGQLAVAGYGAGSKVDLIIARPVLGLASATVTIMGMFAGAGRLDLVRSTVLYTYRWVLIVTVVIGTCAMLASDQIIGLFTNDPYAISVGTVYLTYMIFGYPCMAIGISTGRILQGLGQGLPTLVITSVRVLAISMPMAYIGVYAFDMPITWIWISSVTGGFVAIALAITWVYRSIWRRDPTVEVAP